MVLSIPSAKVNYSTIKGRPLGSCNDLKAVVLLAGTVRTSHLRRVINRSLLELPVTSNDKMIDHGQRQLVSLAHDAQLPQLPVRIMLDRATSPWDISTPPDSPISFSLEHDPYEFRGTGGLVRDLVEQYNDSDRLLIANAGQIQIGSLSTLVQDLYRLDADIVIAARTDGTPVDIVLTRCEALRSIAKIGYVDLKEQALPRIAKTKDVRVHKQSQFHSYPVRTHDAYLAALRQYYLSLQNSPSASLQQGEDWQSLFQIIEPDATVHESAIIHDSVILNGARVEHDAVVVRSIVSPTGVVRAGQSAFDCIVDSNMNPSKNKQK